MEFKQMCHPLCHCKECSDIMIHVMLIFIDYRCFLESGCILDMSVPGDEQSYSSRGMGDLEGSHLKKGSIMIDIFIHNRNSPRNDESA